MGRHAASKDSTVSPPRSNPRALRDFHGTLTSPLESAPLSADPNYYGDPNYGDPNDADPNDADPKYGDPISAADLIARFRASGLLSDVARRTTGPAATGSVNAPAPLPLLKKPVLDKAVAPKSAQLGPTTGPSENLALDPTEPLRVADLLNRHLDLAARAPRTGHRAAPQRPTRAGGRTLSALRPAPSISVALRPMLTVAAIITAFAFVEGPNLLSTSHTSADAQAGRSPATTTVGATVTDPSAADVTVPTTAADLPRHGGTVTAGSGRVSRSTRRAIGAAANHVPLLKPGQTVAGTWIRPSSGRYTSCFCSRWGSFHAGIDLASKLGTPILAVGDGTVINAGPASGFGHWVVIQHSNGDVSIYGHMKYFFVHVGQKVKAGEKIALVGDQGFSTGPHLHFEVHKGGLGGTKINPIPWLKARGIVIGPLSKDG